MKYTIKGKEYTEFDINKRCAELMGLSLNELIAASEKICALRPTEGMMGYVYDPCNNPQDTWPIIEKCWDELMEPINKGDISRWEDLADGCGGSKLVAACICYIEINHSETI